jgi:transposase
MIFPMSRVRIMVATKPVDFRKGHDGLAALVKNELRKDPFTGTVFVFRSRKADRLKLIDLPLNCHPAAIRASVVFDTPNSAV